MHADEYADLIEAGICDNNKRQTESDYVSAMEWRAKENGYTNA